MRMVKEVPLSFSQNWLRNKIVIYLLWYITTTDERLLFTTLSVKCMFTIYVLSRKWSKSKNEAMFTSTQAVIASHTDPSCKELTFL